MRKEICLRCHSMLKGEVSREFGAISKTLKSFFFFIKRNLTILLRFLVDNYLSLQCTKTMATDGLG